MWRMVLLTLIIVLAGCGSRTHPAEFGVMPPIAPVVAEQQASADDVSAASDGVISPSTGGDATPVVEAIDQESVAHRLDVLWANHDWEDVIRLLEDARGKPDAPFDASAMRDKLYAAHINAGYTALRLQNKEA